VLSWFNKVTDKSQYSFIAFDVVDFYSSISIDLLKAALDFASKYDNITDTERKKLLYMRRNRACTRASTGERNYHQIYLMSLWVALMVPNHVNWPVGSFLLHLITMKHGNKFGLYRDDGLGIIKATPRQIELIKWICAPYSTTMV
jgi:hypothetical protein